MEKTETYETEHPDTDEACKENPELPRKLVSNVLHAMDEFGPHERFESGEIDRLDGVE